MPSSKVIRYLTDGFNRRVARLEGTSIKSRYMYQDGLRIAAETTAAGAILKRFVYATKVNVPDYWIDASGVAYRIISDDLGSPRLVLQTQSGAVAQIMQHDPFGRVLRDNSPGLQPFGFAGGLNDKDTHLVRFGAREYDPETGRWLSKDPILFAGGDPNLYGYVGGDPINNIDPLGLYVPVNPILYWIMRGLHTANDIGNWKYIFYIFNSMCGADPNGAACKHPPQTLPPEPAAPPPLTLPEIGICTIDPRLCDPSFRLPPPPPDQCTVDNPTGK